jgi:hypothetical protein
VEQVGGAFLGQALVHLVAAERRPRHRQRGLQQAPIAQSRASAVAPDLMGVDRQDLVER